MNNDHYDALMAVFDRMEEQIKALKSKIADIETACKMLVEDKITASQDIGDICLQQCDPNNTNQLKNSCN